LIMSGVGKILVFVNLLFSVVVGAFIIMVYVARTNWVATYHELENRYKAQSAELETFRTDAQAARDQGSKDVTTAQAELKKIKDDLAVKEGQLKALTDQLTAEKEKTTTGTASTVAVQEESLRRTEEMKRLDVQIKTLTDQRNASLIEQNKLRDRSIAVEIENKTLKDRNNQMALQLENMGKDNIRLRNLGGASGGGTMTAKNPPLENIEGIVTKTDTQSGLLTLSIGSDAGLTKGHTLEIFRLSPNKYLGTVRIVDVTAHEAVARPTSRPTTPIQQGDRVASKILGS